MKHHIPLFIPILSVTFCLAFGSCNLDDDEEVFDVNISGYVLQERTPDGERYYTPYLYVNSSSASFKLAEAKMLGGADATVPLRRLTDYSYISNSDITFPDPSKINGDYTATATSTDGDKASKTLNINLAATDTLGVLDIENFHYSNGTIYATVKKVDNAATLGIIFSVFSSDGPDRGFYSFRYLAVQPILYDSNNRITLSYPFSSTSGFVGDYCGVMVYASNSKGVYAESAMKVLKKGESKFQGD